MFQYLSQSFRRKFARRFTKEYSTQLKVFDVGPWGQVECLSWDNPLVSPPQITEEHLKFFANFLSEGDLAIDIGANTGHLSVMMGLLTGPLGKVLAFDPNKIVFDILEKNSKLNSGRVSIDPFCLAIYERDQELFYSSSEASFNNGGVSETPKSYHGRFRLPALVKGVRLESFLETRYALLINRLKLIKIDTEGYDRKVIESIAGLLVKHRPVVISECFSGSEEGERTLHFNVLRSLGYDLFYTSDFRSNAQREPILNASEMMKRRHFDFIAIPRPS